ncbi:MAG: class I SAM-dependent rRNA methyltransferase [Bacteriovoracaceae bacterium]|nr:class I SAM-dependent rRNA methyltransferase [Bacteriovoracaceae bacterium]
MNNIFERPFPRVELHPATLKHLRKGHPWTTKDKFTELFPRHRLFIIGTDRNSNETALLLHDPNHPKVKARAWTLKPPFVEAVKNFRDELYQRLQNAFRKRTQSTYYSSRDNLYLVFGEGDFLPGLFIQKFGDTYLIQYYARFWVDIEKILLSIFRKVMKEFDLSGQLLIQERYPNAKSKCRRVDKKGQVESTVIDEEGIKMEVHPGRAHDPGVYTDAASIREKLTNKIKECDSLLNLYCYTGAFSLKALKEDVSNVTSVDLSPKYIKQLEKNIELNDSFDKSKHKSVTGDVNKVIADLVKNKDSFDMIICDPPSASSDGKKMSSAVKNYEKLLPKLGKLVNTKGSLVIFLNTHNVTRKSFKSKIQEIIKSSKMNFEIKNEWSLGDDCPVTKGFPEGDYLKVLVLEKK